MSADRMSADAVFTTTFPSTSVSVVGAMSDASGIHGPRPRRLPAWTRRQIPDPVFDFVVGMTSGVRIAACTAATRLTLEIAIIGIDTGLRPAAPAVLDLLVDGRHRERVFVPGASQTLVAADGAITQEHPPVVLTFHPGSTDGEREVEIWLPHTTAVELVALSADAAVTPPRDDRPIWVHHGSSISQCGEASAPTRTWPAIAAEQGGYSLRSLGFSGNAVGDPFVARTIRDQPADVISIEIGINVVNGDLMRRRMFEPVLHGFLDTVRDGHPQAPLLVLGPIPCPAHEEAPGPTVLDDRGRAQSAGAVAEIERGAMNLRIVRDAVARVLAARADDPRLFFVDGRELLPDAEVADLDDGLHPNAAAYERMGRRFAAHAFSAGGPFSATASDAASAGRRRTPGQLLDGAVVGERVVIDSAAAGAKLAR